MTTVKYDVTTNDVTLLHNYYVTSSLSEQTTSADPQLNLVETNVPAYLSSIYIIIAVVGATGNLLVFSILCKHYSRRASVTESLLLHQTVVDEITCIWVALVAIFPPATFYPPSPAGEGGEGGGESQWQQFMCRVWNTQLPMWTSFSASCYNLLAITFEQYFEIVHPVVHKTYLRRLSPAVPVALVWLCSIVCNVTSYVPDSALVDGYCLAWSYFPSFQAAAATGVWVLMYLFIIPGTLMIVCFWRMAHVMHSRSTRISYSASIAATFSQAKVGILKTLILFCVTLIACWSYNTILFFLTFINALDANFYTSWKYHLSVLLLFLSCSINPFIYSANYKKFRRNLHQCLANTCLTSLLKRPSVDETPSTIAPRSSTM